MRKNAILNSCVLAAVLALSGCSGDPVLPMPLVPSPVSSQPVLPPPVSPGQGWLAGYTLTGASLSGFVFESRPDGHVPIAGAMLYCELCGETTHTWATADANGFYRFPGDIATGGGVWLAPGRATPVLTGGVDFEQQTFVGRSLNVEITGDTRLDVELVRR